MTEWTVEVFCPILFAPSGRFGRTKSGLHYADELYLTGLEVNSILHARAWWPDNVHVTSEYVTLGVTEPDGATIRAHHTREYVQGRKMRFLIDSEPKSLPWAPWKLRSAHKLDGSS